MILDPFVLVVLLGMVAAAVPVWPWSRPLGARPLIVAGLCLTGYLLLVVWTL